MCRNACVQVWPWLYVLLAFAPHLGCPFGMTCSPAHARASRHTHQASLDAYYIYFFKITDQLASLTFIFLLLHVSSTISLPFHPKKKRFCTSLFDNTRDSCVAFPLPCLSPHFPCTSNPHSQPIHVFQSTSHARRMGRKWAGDILLEGVNGYHQMALWSADNYGAGPAHQMQGAPSFPHFFLLQYRRIEMPSTLVQGPIKQLWFYLFKKKRSTLLSQREMSERVCKPTA